MIPVCRTCPGRPRGACVFCDECLEKTRMRYRAICAITTRYDFAAPVTSDDLEHVRGELVAALAPVSRGDQVLLGPVVTRHGDAIRIVVGDERGRCYYERDMLVAKPT